MAAHLHTISGELMTTATAGNLSARLQGAAHHHVGAATGEHPLCWETISVSAGIDEYRLRTQR